ncbi:AbfA Alpha-L-arabinofuranosidase [Candidatus Nanopelagicaceae bacterium]
MSKSKIVVDRHFEISEIDERVYGSFAEHMGRCIYGGIYEPDSSFSDENGFRKDVMELVKELGVTMVRYPGGNFLSGYDWKDGIGPKEDRPARLDLAWHGLETNQFGLDEFMVWADKTDIEPMMAVNLGTNGLKEALDLIEYTNVDAKSKWAQERVKNGHSKPYDIKVWCLGNEMDGPWQLGHKNAEDYATLAADVARGMHQIGENLQLVACGSSNRSMPTFGAWEETVLEKTYDLVDHISLHTYYEDLGDTQEFLIISTDLDYMINEVCNVADAVKAKLRSKKTITLSLDEWNVWNLSQFQSMERPKEWLPAQRVIEDEYTFKDAVVLGNLLISILRRSDRVKMACIAQLVNVIAPIRAEANQPAWRQTTFYPFAYTSRFGRGKTLITRVEAPAINSARFGDVNAIDAITTYDEKSKKVAIFIVNRSLTETIDTSILLSGFKNLKIVDQVTMAGSDWMATNNASNPDKVKPATDINATVSDKTINVNLAPVSWQVIHVSVDAD